MSGMIAPLYNTAILLPILAFPSWILCLPPLVWHFRQGNIAAGSLILWACLVNFFNSINPLIWPRDNLTEWWNGNVWCDINVRIQIGAIVGTTASAVMIVRKLAKVMDTSSMTVITSRNSKVKEQCLEVAWCWVYPLVLIIVYYVVQPVRYMLYSIQGCLPAYDTSWPSIVLSFMWAPLTTLVAAGYAGLLTYRLYIYRQEFARLISARNTTKSRFIRLLIICLIVIVVYVPYTCYLLAALVRLMQGQEPYSRGRVHDSTTFNTIMRVPTYGRVPIDKWGQVATGYVIFFVFGTGADAWKTYKKMGLALGLGKWFPALYKDEESGNSTPTSMRTWTSRTKSALWSRSGSVSAPTTTGDTMRNTSVVMAELPEFRSTMTEEPVLPPRESTSTRSSFLSRIFSRTVVPHAVLPLFTHRSHFIPETRDSRPPPRDRSPGVSARAWATQSDKSSSRHESETDGVRVFREVRIASQVDEEAAGKKSSDDMA
ncbi:STE3-domain-containing protein [Ophiobolus disseminans]|uniref:STE3-domain-containing protein n=1 Tax=Ophiobolus disseminans TaxID=1469910 RepID=A0A6A6ZS26_9PLEO|nr:STE3-domain-containing protein [Ophiobolus disseminans]